MRAEFPQAERDAGRESPVVEAKHPDRPASVSSEIISYFTILSLALGLGTPAGIAAIPIGYYLKDALHLTPLQLATFTAIVSVPAYVGFLFGFMRDRVRPPGWGDRGYLILGALVAIASYLWLGLAEITYLELVCLVFIVVVAYVLLSAAAQALTTGVAQAYSMTGRLSVVLGFGFFVPAVLSALLGGWLVAHLSAQGTFLLAASVTGVIVLQAFWRLDAVVTFERIEVNRNESVFGAIARLIAHRPIWPAALIFFLWNFGPGWGTPMFYHLTETVKISSEAFGTFTALQSAFFLPTTLLYGLLCRRMRLSQLLWWGTLVAILQGPIMFFAHSVSTAMAVAVLYGLFGGFGTAAYVDLIMRSCPKGLEGTGAMLTNSALAIAGNAGNVFGSWIYSRGGFASAVIITTLATTLIVPVLWWVPENITATREGERP